MAQQINLLTPILLAPRRHFSALALLQATALLLLAGLAAALWLQQRDRSAEAAHRALLANYAAERQQLTVARANLPAPQDAGRLQQQLALLEAGNTERRALLQALGAEGGEDGVQAGRHHSDLLALIARTLPEAAWLGELHHSAGRVELVGGTLNTAALRPWLGQLSAHPLLAGQTLSALRVERVGAAGSDAGKPLLPGSDALGQARLPVWAFRVVSAPARPAASGATR